MKRFTDTNKWEKNWFRKLSPEYKCFWYYFTEHCDGAGVWEPDFELVHTFIGKKIEQNIAFDLFNKGKTRVIVLDNGDWYIPDFISFQCGELSDTCPAHKPIFKLLQKHNLPDRVVNRVSNTLQEKEKDIDKEKDKDKREDKEEEIRNIFGFYTKVLERPTYKLTTKRKEKISQRLKEPLIGSIEWARTRFIECLIAICQVSLSNFHQGENKAGKRYVELDAHIFRTEEQLEQRLNEAIEVGNLEKIQAYLQKEGYV